MPPLYTPVQERYAMPGPTYQLGDSAAGNLRIEVDEKRDEYLREKQGSVGHWESRAAQSEYRGRLTQWLKDAMRRDQPGIATSGANPDELIAQIQEDVVLMHRPAGSPASRAKAVYLNVAFPSGWCPQCTVGKGFLSIHVPVPGFDEFGPLGRKDAAEFLFSGADKVRFVWSLAPDTRLDRRQCRLNHGSTRVSWSDASELYLRVERQVISPIDESTACFLIRIYTYGLKDLETKVRDSIRSSLISMPEDVRSYKGYASDFEHILSLI